jgi:tetratricopeptide (TPR) repeat protein
MRVLILTSLLLLPLAPSHAGPEAAGSGITVPGLCDDCEEPNRAYGRSLVQLDAARRALTEQENALQRLRPESDSYEADLQTVERGMRHAQTQLEQRTATTAEAATQLRAAIDRHVTGTQEAVTRLQEDRTRLEQSRRTASAAMHAKIDAALDENKAQIGAAQLTRDRATRSQSEIYSTTDPIVNEAKKGSNGNPDELASGGAALRDLERRKDADAARRDDFSRSGMLGEDKNTPPPDVQYGGPQSNQDFDPEAAGRTIDYLDGVIDENPNDASALGKRAMVNWRLGNTGAACADANAALALDPEESRSQGISKLGCGDKMDLAMDFKAKPKLQPTDPGPSKRPLGIGAQRTGKVPSFSGIPQMKSKAPTHQRARFQAHEKMEQARRLSRSGDITAAGAAAIQALQINPADISAYKLLAQLYGRSRDYKQMLQAAERALMLNPNDANALLLKSQALYKLGDTQGAKAAAEQVLKMNPANAFAHAMLGYALGAEGDRSGMLRALAQASAFDPKFQQLLALAKAMPLDEFLAHLPGEQREKKESPKKKRRLILKLIPVALLLAAGAFLAFRPTKKPATPAPAAAGLPGGAAAQTAPAQPTLLPGAATSLGKSIGGKYELNGELGAGGMGVVYEGYDSKLDRSVAIKRMRPELKADPRAWENFVKEAKIVSHLSHPYIVGIHEMIEEGPEAFLVFDLVQGQSLAQILQAQRAISFPQAKDILTKVCEAVQYAHDNKVLHRDLKPANIMFDSNGYPRIMDFGVAREAKETLSKYTHQDSSGTPLYMAPEQHVGKAGRASDIFSLGVCFYEMLTGTVPYNGADLLTAKERKAYTPARQLVPTLPPNIDMLFAAALEPDPQKRIASAAELAELLGQM